MGARFRLGLRPHHSREIRISPGLAVQIFERIAAGGIFVDIIVQSFGRRGHANLSFTVPQAAVGKANCRADGG
jgi:hypothetical protein